MNKKAIISLFQICKYSFAMVVIFALMSYFQVQLGFKHSHYLEDGTKIEHAHPFSDENGNQHDHSKSEISFLNLLNPHVDLDQGFINLIVKSTEKPTVPAVLREEIIQLMKFPLNTLRGPPSC